MIKSKFKFFTLSTLIIYGLHTTAQGASSIINNNENRIINNLWDLGLASALTVGETTSGSVAVNSGGNIKASLLHIGINGGDGLININSGGKININNDNNFAYPLAIGGEGDNSNTSQGSTGTLNIIGSGSQLNFNYSSIFSGEVSVGSSGAHGILNILDGGQLNAITQDGFWIGSRGSQTTQGTVNVDGQESTLYSNQRILVGTLNEGHLNVTGGGKVTTDSYISIGRALGNTTVDNTLYVSGPGSLVQAGSYIETGFNGKGSIIVSDYGTLSGTELIIARNAGMVGELIIGSRAGQTPNTAGVINTPVVRFGSGQGQLTFNHTNSNYQFTPAISGHGTVHLLSGITALTSTNNIYTGTTMVSAHATLQAGAPNTFSPNSDYTIGPQGQIDLHGHNQTILSLSNQGTLSFSPDIFSENTTLRITGNYEGQNGTIIMNGVLGKDTDLVDRLEIGGNATGTTYVQVNNLGGHGAQTVEGLQIIGVAGISNPDAFSQKGRIVAGAYEYQLVQGNTSQTDTQGWFLTSVYSPPPVPVDPPPVGPPPIDPPPVTPLRLIRPEGAAYLSNLAIANTLFNMRLSDRLGKTVTPSSPDTTRLTPWIRYDYRYNKSTDNSGQLSSSGHTNLIQVGTSLLEFDTPNDARIDIGVMGGYGHYSGDSKNILDNYTASNKLQGYHMGIYGTLYAQPDQKNGSYIDTWLMWNHFNADIHGQDLVQEGYHLNGLSASIEVGYTINTGQIHNYTTSIQPQAQFIWTDVKANNHREANGTLVTEQAGNLRTRLGARFSATSGQNTISETTLTPYIEANWIHNSKPFDISMDSTSIKQAGARNIAEIKMGMEAQIETKTKLSLDLGYQAGNSSNHTTQFNFSLKHAF